MGTRFEVFLGGDDQEHLEAVAVAVLEEIKRLDAVLSRFDSSSEIARINREAYARPVRVDAEVCALLERCEQARQMTNGYFDVTATREADNTTPVLQLDPEAGTVSFTQPQVMIDLGGVGKGYALDQGGLIMRRFNVTCGLLHGGTSSVLALDALDGDEGWLVTVRHPRQPEAAPVAALRMAARALSCSAARHPGQVQSDIVNPLTGHALDSDAACVVLTAQATDAEIFSTALLAMGRPRAVNYLANNSAIELMVGWIEADANLVWL